VIAPRTGIRLGAFELLEPLGHGGMGAVWRGRHEASGAPVAIKVMTGHRAAEEEFRRAFREEVRAVAALEHPGIVVVLDLGEVDGEAARRSGGEIVAGTPWLAMELGTLGTLRDVPRPLAWPVMRTALLGLLDALAHAHARGVIHRDLKPANVMLARAGERFAEPPEGVPEPWRLWDGTVRLLDFGLAHAGEERDDAGDTELAAGTPFYMSPEQFRGHWRDYGPWTDLYALGCMAYELATGRLAFHGDSMFSLAFAHTMGDRPPKVEDARLPSGFGDWVGRLIEREPERRFARAADAADALFALGGGGGEGGEAAAGERGAGRGSTRSRLPGLGSIGGGWRRVEVSRPPPRLLGAGLGLYGIRAIPFVGREALRDTLWNALGDVRSTGRARALLLHGPAGTGKSRLASWLCERAHELGAADVLRATHGVPPLPRDGVAGMVARQARSGGLDGTALRERLEGLLRELGAEDPWEWTALAEVARPPGFSVGAAPSDSHDRHASAARWMRRLAQRRPLLVHCDDVTWGADTLAFVLQVLRAQASSPAAILFVLTARDEAWIERPVESAARDELLRQPRCSQLEVPPLPADEHSALLRELLPLDAALAARVHERTAGNPLFVVQIVAEQVARGELEAGPGGFRARQGAADRLPDDLHATWASRVGRVAAALPDGTAATLELAACLGAQVDLGEWAAACMEAGLAAVPLGEVADALLREKLAVPADGGWAFVHGMARETLLRASADAGRAAALHGACAAILEALGDGDADAERDERRGRHLLAAGRADEARAPLLRAARACKARGEARRALVVLELLEGALPSGSAGDRASREEVEALLLRAWASRIVGDVAASARAAGAACDAADDVADPALEAEGLLRLAQAAHALGDWEESARIHRRAAGAAALCGARQLAGEAAQALADVALRAGRLDEAEAAFREAGDALVEAGDLAGRGRCLRALGIVARRRGQAGRARELLEESRTCAAQAGHRAGLADVANSLGELAREARRLDEAEACYREALALYESLGALAALFPRVNLGLVLGARGAEAEADAVLAVAADGFREAGKSGAAASVEAMRLPLQAALGRWERFESELPRVCAALEGAGAHDPDVADALGRAGDAAAREGRGGEARLAWQAALRQWEGAGRGGSEEARGIASRLAGTGGQD
jgi:tetratricopeptide (TPR) repeat protein